MIQLKMAILPIVTGAENPILRKKTKRVKRVTKEVLTFIEDLQDTVIARKGAGIAAPQVGSNQRICLALIGKRMVTLIDPLITWMSDETVTGDEGCLSLPGIWLRVERAKSIVLSYIDEKGKPQERKLSGWDARVVQHEVDHLDGILIVDRSSEHVTVTEEVES